MKRLFLLFSLVVSLQSFGQRCLSLDSCRALALRNNKQLSSSRLSQEVAQNVRKAAKTQFLPKVDILGGYQYVSREISLLNDRQKNAFSHLGTNALSGASGSLPQLISGLVQQGLISPQFGQDLSGLMSQIGQPLAQVGNQIGQQINDAFKTDTKNIWSGAVMLRQPIYMGGAITAANKAAEIGEEMSRNDLSLKSQSTLYNIDQVYWTVVSLRQKQKLAHSYRDLVKKLDEDVYKMIREGVATRADGLKVDVRVNEADMQITQVEDGLTLSRMLLCQLCGLPLDETIVLADENKETLGVAPAFRVMAPDSDLTSRPEIRLLQNAVDISRQNARLVRAIYLPHIALTGGYLISNPNLFNGFERKFSGVWNVGLTVQIPVWNWFEGTYKVRASKASTHIAQLELADAREKIQLQVSQSQFKVKEAQKKLAMAQKNLISAEENLRCANVGFQEGVMEVTDVMAAQTAWQQAQSQKIDAEVDVRLSQVNLQKALGVLE